jgi:hypothetical protein
MARGHQLFIQELPNRRGERVSRSAIYHAFSISGGR